jgi:hypothetical protein
MRSKVFLSLLLVIGGFLLSCLFFIFVNVEIEMEPFATWTELPYAGMFQYAGLVCLAGAIIYLWMEGQDSFD